MYAHVVMYARILRMQTRSWIFTTLAVAAKDARAILQLHRCLHFTICVSSLRRGYVKILCIVPILTDVIPEGNPVLQLHQILLTVLLDFHDLRRGGQLLCGRSAN